MKRIGDVLGSFNRPEDGPNRPPSRAAARAITPGDSEVCPICKGKGFLVYDVPPGHPDFSKVLPCRCTQARMAQERAQNLRSVSNLGQLSRMTFDNFIPGGANFPEHIRFTLQQAYELALGFARQPNGWLVLLGGYGCGKTHLAAAIANQQLVLGNPVMFVVVTDLLDYLRAAFAPDSATTLDERLDAIRDTPLLILDDLGAHNSTAWAQEKLFQILNHRYNGRLPTVITSNQRLEDLDPRVASRLADMDLSQVYEIVAPDYRAGTERSSSSLSTLRLHADQTFDTFARRPDLPIEWQENLEMARSRAQSFAVEPNGWLVLTGNNGCGKTHLAAAIANYQTAAGRPAPMFVVTPDLLDHLRATFSPTSSTTMDRAFEQVRAAPLLVLDDLGMESATPWAREKLFQLLNHRYVARAATVITTARVITEIEPWLQTRMLDKDRCTVFAIEAPSYRGSASQRQQSKGGKGEQLPNGAPDKRSPGTSGRPSGHRSTNPRNP
jgi:DNA replication protein DnaC